MEIFKKRTQSHNEPSPGPSVSELISLRDKKAAIIDRKYATTTQIILEVFTVVHLYLEAINASTSFHHQSFCRNTTRDANNELSTTISRGNCCNPARTVAAVLAFGYVKMGFVLNLEAA